MIDIKEALKKIKLFALDMDGTIYLGEKWIDGAQDFLKKIQETGRDFVFMTNNSSKNSGAYIEKLNKMGLNITEDKLITSGHATINYLLNNYKDKRVFLLGNDLLKDEFRKNGIILDEKTPEVVVTAFDTTLDYKKMCMICDFLREGLPFIGTHPDFNCPTETGFIPDIGAIHAFIEASTGRLPDLIVGKPNREIINYMLNKTKSSPDEVAVIGDRLYTDVASGVNNGLMGILVLSGEATLKDVSNSDVKPSFIFESVNEIIKFL